MEILSKKPAIAAVKGMNGVNVRLNVKDKSE